MKVYNCESEYAMFIVSNVLLMRYNDQEQYYSTLFFRKTSKSDLVAMVSGIQPGILMSRFFFAACCPNIS